VPGATIRLLDPRSPTFGHDVAVSRAVARLGFGAPANATPLEEATSNSLTTRAAGPAERDAAVEPHAPAELERLRTLSSGVALLNPVAESPTEGILATGAIQRAENISEVVGVATLPSARNRGYASQLTATLAHRTLDAGATTVFVPGNFGEDVVVELVAGLGEQRVSLIGLPDLPAPARLQELGVARVSYGPLPQRVVLAELQDLASYLYDGGTLPLAPRPRG
jgi:GNAT superfamily N-acetyltransferase